MEEINSHIVSSLKWETTFDQKGEAYRLQERLSSWSKISLPREVANVFNELCPPEQSWRIQSLELNLGSLDYNDLEYDLNTKLRRYLREKIAELIINQNNQKQNRIAVFNKEKSILENLTIFLMEGYLPWNYQNKEGSINQIMADLLQNNLSEVIALIKKAGITHEQVRKRMAWQFDEKNITKIISALEPNNSSPIIEFASIMTNLQTKETIVQTSTASFKKNLWFFILNFLLLERGTLFNKIAFMKSSILQMANHYNIAYSDLILLIENTIVKLSDKTTQNNNFILSLKTLTKEYETQKKDNYPPKIKTNYWDIFERLLKNKTERKSKTGKNNLNELIFTLRNENKTKFNEIANRVLNTEKSCISIIQDLNEISIKILFSKLDTTPSSLNIETIIYLNTLSSNLKLKTNSKMLWEIGIVFLLKNKNANHTDFLLFCIKKLGKRNNLDTEKLLESFTSAKIPASIKNNRSMEIYNNLTAVYCSEINRNSSNYPAKHFENLLSKLELQLQKTSSKKELFIDLQRSLIKSISLHPKMAFEVMLSYGNKEFLKKILPLVLNRELLQLLVKEANIEKTKLVLTIQTVYEILNAKEKYDFPEELLDNDLLLFGIEEILLRPEHNSSSFIETVIIQLSKKVTNSKRKEYFQFITKLMQTKKIKSFGIEIQKSFLNQLKSNSSIDVTKFCVLIQGNKDINMPENRLIMNETAANRPSNTNKNSFLNQKLTAKKREEWCFLIICQKQIPTDFDRTGKFEINHLLQEIILKHPKIFFKIIKKKFIPEAQMDWLSRTVNFNHLCGAIVQLDKTKESYLRILQKFHSVLGIINFRGITSKEIQSLLTRKLIKASANNNWTIISIEKIWNELIWELVTKKGVSKKNFLMDIEKHIYQFPLSLQLSFREVLNTEKQIFQTSKKVEILSKIEKIQTNQSAKSPIKEGIAVRNAGIVILNSYIVMLFERLKLVLNNQFSSTENQINAVHYLQYVITGLSKTEETFLPLNKVLCGLPLTHAVPDGIEISNDNKQLIDGLIKAAISYWSAIGDCSIDGFRGNWLVRDGILVELADKWELTVDKRAYDVLINKSPFAFSIIKYPWMDKPLHVIWPY
ncbi:contractile injection system tape measure protein [Flavobacterium sp. N3904]|uniref:contractile injection system tape measure protein n=1 Tax=Flavobacterium sp. N3904 TaxID=2986835 RepID=UPI0022251027|nr:contractile injection system tape measure protein [Flavobacterium sp. N3904]